MFINGAINRWFGHLFIVLCVESDVEEEKYKLVATDGLNYINRLVQPMAFPRYGCYSDISKGSKVLPFSRYLLSKRLDSTKNAFSAARQLNQQLSLISQSGPVLPGERSTNKFIFGFQIGSNLSLVYTFIWRRHGRSGIWRELTDDAAVSAKSKTQAGLVTSARSTLDWHFLNILASYFTHQSSHPVFITFYYTYQFLYIYMF